MDTVLLKNGSWSCRVFPHVGSNVISLRHGDFPILREPEDEEKLRATPTVYGIPSLLPPNRTANGTFTFDGITYTMPINEPARGNFIHGRLHVSAFDVIEQSEHELKTRLVNQSELFPFPFQLDLTDTLLPDGFCRTAVVTNTGATAMPLVFAYHTTFTAPEYFKIPLGAYWVIDERYIPTGEKRPLDEEQTTFFNGCTIHGQDIDGFYEMAGNTARIGDYLFQTEGFDQWILYNRRGSRELLCVEPQLGPVNALNSGGYKRLEPGEQYTFTIRISHV